MSSSTVPVTCPACFQVFEVVPPAPSELPAEWDYDCEVCCHPMMIRFDGDEDGIFADAHGLSE